MPPPLGVLAIEVEPVVCPAQSCRLNARRAQCVEIRPSPANGELPCDGTDATCSSTAERERDHLPLGIGGLRADRSVRKRTTPRYPDVRPIRNRPVSRLQTREQTRGRASAPLRGRDQHIRCGLPQARARRRSSPARPCTRPDKPGTLALLASWSGPPRTSITESTEQHSGSLTSWGLAILRACGGWRRHGLARDHQACLTLSRSACA